MNQTISREKALEKVRHLIAKAMSTHSVEESRTCAQAAVQIITKYSLVVALSAGYEYRAPTPIPEPRRERPPPPPKERIEPRWINAKYPGTCLFCFDRFEVGDQVYWTQGEGCVCRDCAEEI